MTGRRPMTQEQVLKYLQENVHIDEDCRLWAGMTRAQGYPAIMWCRRIYQARILLLKLLGRRMPERPVTWDVCGNRLCMNPEHIRVGTRKQMLSQYASRGHFLTGPRRSLATAMGLARVARMGIDKAGDVYLMRSQGATTNDIARCYGITADSVRKSMQAWRRAGVNEMTVRVAA